MKKRNPIAVLCNICALSGALASTPARAANETVLPIRVNIVQCGKRDEIPKMCQKDSRCCVFLNATDHVNASNNNANDNSGIDFKFSDLTPELVLE